MKFYTEVLGLRFVHAIRNDHVPSTGEFYPHMHVFFELGDGSYIAFFELATAAAMQPDPNTPAWVQHLALEIDGPAQQQAYITRLKAHGVDFIGPTDHGFVQSIYLFDPSGHRLELTYRSDAPGELNQAAIDAPILLAQWAHGASKT